MAGQAIEKTRFIRKVEHRRKTGEIQQKHIKFQIKAIQECMAPGITFT
jgi:hypothetical protein